MKLRSELTNPSFEFVNTMTQFDKTLQIMKKFWLVDVFAVLMVVCFLFVDKPLAIYLQQLDLRTNMHWLYWVTALGQWKIYVLLFLGLALFFRFIKKDNKSEKNAWFLLACIVLVNIINCVVKIVLGRARPELWFTHHEYGFYWFALKNDYWSMPSGHSMTISALVSGLGVVFPRYFWPLLLVVLMVLASRVLLTYHYLSDVLMGFYLAVLGVGLIASYFKQKGFLHAIK